MILGAISDALSQLSDPRFRSVLARGLALTIALLIAAYLLAFWGIQWLLPDSFSVPLIGEITFVDNLASWGSLILMIGLSVFLMVPVAATFTGLFLDDVADAVEARHYPHLPQAARLPLPAALREAIGFLGVLIGANVAALIAYLIFAPFAPAIFYALNGYLLGREYYRMIAVRHLGRKGAQIAFRANLPLVWLTGAIMAVPLTIPVVNLLVPVIGVAAFTHLFHRTEPT